MRMVFATLSTLSLILSFVSSSFGQAEIRINDKMAPPSGWAVISLRQGSEPRPIGSGQGGMMGAFGSMFESDPLILVENSSGEVTFRIDEFGPDGILFSFESSVPDVGLDNSQPFAYIALRVSPNAVPGMQATIGLDPNRTVMYDETGEPYQLRTREGRFTVGGLSISCMNPLTGMVRAGEQVTLRGVGFEPRARVEFDGVEARSVVVNANTIVATAPMDFLADYVEVKVRNRTPGPDGRRPQDVFVSYRFGCFEN